MMTKSVIKFWMRELFYDLKLLPRVFFLCYVMGSEGDHDRPVAEEKEGQGETVTVWGFSCDTPIMRKGDWSFSLGHRTLPTPLFLGHCGIGGGGSGFSQGRVFPGNRDNFQNP